MSSVQNSRSSALLGAIRCSPRAWALIIGGIAVTVFSSVIDGAVSQFVTATFEEFGIILIMAILAICCAELRSSKLPCKKMMPDDDEIQKPMKATNIPSNLPGPSEAEEWQREEISLFTANFMAAMNTGELSIAEVSMERLERLQVTSGRKTLQNFCNECYGELVSGFIKVGQIENAKRWFKALMGTVPKSRLSKKKEADEQKRWQEIDAFTEQMHEIVRKLVREGRVFEAESLLSFLQDFAPIVPPNVACSNSVISACAKVGNVVKAEVWLTQMMAMDLCPDEASFAALINAYARKGNIVQAKKWLDKMQETVTQAQIQSYNFDLVFQACGQLPNKNDEGSSLRLDAPVFQPCNQIMKTVLRSEAPAFESGMKQNTKLRSEAPLFQSTISMRSWWKPEQNLQKWSNRIWGRWTNSQKKREDTHLFESWSLLEKTANELEKQGFENTNVQSKEMQKPMSGARYEAWDRKAPAKTFKWVPKKTAADEQSLEKDSSFAEQ